MNLDFRNNWIYFKLYTNDNLSETVLGRVTILIEKIEEKASWFFIRYKDPFYHLRLRVNFSNKSLNALFKKALEEFVGKNCNLVFKVIELNYERELEKYHFFQIEFTEELFWLDSQISASMLNASVDDKVKTNMMSSYNLLQSFYSEDEKIIKLINSILPFYYKEFGLISNLKKQISQKYRLSNYKLVIDRDSPINFILRKRNQLIKNQIINSKHGSLDQFVTNHIHTNTNRMFINNQKLYELITYEFLIRSLKSKMYFEKVS